MSVAIAKMSETRRSLGSLASDMNVGGSDYLRRRAGFDWTPLDRHTRRVYERQEEAWRPLNKQRVAAFVRIFVLCLVDTENGHRRDMHTQRSPRCCTRHSLLGSYRLFVGVWCIRWMIPFGLLVCQTLRN